MSEETELWAWFVFHSGLSTQRAKTLLETWQAQDISLAEALAHPRSQTARLGLTAGEAGLLASGRAALVASTFSVPALTWRDHLYPPGLRALPLRTRPAVLFYQGTDSLLSRAVVYLAPGVLSADAEERAREAISLLLGEDILLAAFEDTPQAALGMAEMLTTEGEMLLFAQSGLRCRSPSERELQLRTEDRLVVLSPLPPDAPHQASLDMVLHQVAWYAADRVILTGDGGPSGLPSEWLNAKPILELATSARRPAPIPWTITEDPTDVLAWIGGQLTVLPSEHVWTIGTKADDASLRPGSATTQDIADADTAPPLAPLSAEDILRTLGQGGAVPEKLRRRILGSH